MTIAMQPIYTQTVSGTSTIAITFNNIPQTFTDLKIAISARANSFNTSLQLTMSVNVDSSSLYSTTYLYGSGSATSSSRQSTTYWLLGNINNAGQTSNTFNSVDCYLPNYVGSNFKQMIADSVTENNATAADQWLIANLYRSTNPITSLSVGIFGQIIAPNSTFTLYGITKG